MIRIGPAQDVPRVLDYRMLKPAACTKERNGTAAGVANGKQCTFHAPIRAGRHAPQTIEPGNSGDGSNLFSWNPLKTDFNVQRICRKLQSRWDSLVCWDRLAVVTNQADCDVLSHRS